MSRVPKTVEAYLTATNVDALEAEGELLPHEAQALEALRAAAAAAAPPVLSGTDLYLQLAASKLLSTGCEAIDEHLLRGGLRPGQLVEVCGESGELAAGSSPQMPMPLELQLLRQPSHSIHALKHARNWGFLAVCANTCPYGPFAPTASGKTQLCLTAAATAARQAKRVVYIDTSNALRGKRLQQVVESLPPLAPQADQPTAADPLKFVEVRRCYDVHSLLQALDELLSHQAQQVQQAQQAQRAPQNSGGPAPNDQQNPGQDVQQQQQQQQPAAAMTAAPTAAGGARRRLEDLPIELLIIDSLSALITPVLGGGAGQHSQGHALLAAAATSLKAFAAGPGLPAVVVTNHMVGGSDERRHEKRPAMGESWRNQPHSRIQLCKGPPGSASEQQCTAVLRASPLLPPGISVPYTLGTAGVAAGPEAAEVQPQPMQL
ncbi:hypothetical protein COHA_003616 [Chlorella ohadii]|uniref:RecA family profile 1 domain-containing protein n=1 Tax=Chlorella ohadii TaxID=2649997 RepID=A0AAD5DV44_9CHLO|nr:hypothetical protein COHA_003616 [Chlorella ohadii]